MVYEDKDIEPGHLVFHKETQELNDNIKILTLKARSHCAIFSDCDCDLFLLIMGCVGVGDVVAVA